MTRFSRSILQIPEIATSFTRYRLYFDSDYTSQDTFTALGSAYFIRENVPIEQWNFTTSSFQQISDRQIHTGNLINAQTLRKEKYPREFFPEAKWSRKGFTQTRWSINNFIFDMVNVHLFHDASNILAVEQSPSVYSIFRKNALQYTLQRLPLNSSDESVPYVIFGDFNFRLDTKRLVQNFMEKRNGSIDKIKQGNTDEICKIIIENAQNKTKLLIEKKEFNLHDDHDTFFSSEIQQFQTYDCEPSVFTDYLYEFEKKFAPSYPYSEEQHEPRAYLRARCPAWCDRILLNHVFKKSVASEKTQPTYNVIGENVCMGDHKPVYLALTVDLVQGSSASPSSLPDSVSLSPLPFSTNTENRISLTNHTDNMINQPKSLVTVTRDAQTKMRTDLIVNETHLSSDNTDSFNVHDYALFIQPSVLPQWWLEKLQQRPPKSPNTMNNSSKLWTKVRAITFMTTLAHRTGSWYSDDRTEISPMDEELSLSDNDENVNTPNFDFNDIQLDTKPDLAIPLRRSFSSIDCVKHPERYTSTISRSRSTTLISTPELTPTESPFMEPSTAAPPPLSSPSSSAPPPSMSPSSRVYRFLHCTNDNSQTIQNMTSDNHSVDFKSSQPTNHSKIQFNDCFEKKECLKSTPTDTNDNVQRTVLVQHRFHADIKRTFTRWIRETPV
ncbi:unnamed protein product [Adineta ricciae]|uniref:inositol-polyphosphate 5-phosphatase n=1 Tax=Adineta ricciae TaxID=249248 RepID=A0A816C4S9_ADIRI|nr:unnamed protein product [Adineta ricciae]